MSGLSNVRWMICIELQLLNVYGLDMQRWTKYKSSTLYYFHHQVAGLLQQQSPAAQAQVVSAY
jgi:hypothetical protein